MGICAKGSSCCRLQVLLLSYVAGIPAELHARNTKASAGSTPTYYSKHLWLGSWKSKSTLTRSSHRPPKADNPAVRRRLDGD
jgi:hypothetical protein